MTGVGVVVVAVPYSRVLVLVRIQVGVRGVHCVREIVDCPEYHFFCFLFLFLCLFV